MNLKPLRSAIAKCVEANLTTPAQAECLILKMLNNPLDPHQWVHERINKRATLAALIARHQQGGMIRVEESGRDCDCVEYSGRVHTCEASIRAFHKLEQEIGEWADGPFRLSIIPFSAEVSYESRDLVMEAREDGHPHVIHSRFP